jgi:hypothetical protein
MPMERVSSCQPLELSDSSNSRSRRKARRWRETSAVGAGMVINPRRRNRGRAATCANSEATASGSTPPLVASALMFT